MKKQIHYFSNGSISVSSGLGVEIQQGDKPIKTIDIDMDDGTFNKWQDNPKKYMSKFHQISQRAVKFKKKFGTIRMDKQKIFVVVRDLPKEKEPISIKEESLATKGKP